MLVAINTNPKKISRKINDFEVEKTEVVRIRIDALEKDKIQKLAMINERTLAGQIRVLIKESLDRK